MPDRKQAKGGEHDIGRNSPKRTKTFSPGHPMLDPLPDPNPVKSPQGSPNLSGDNLVRPKTLRILIIGRANSGKTTILQKICQSDKPVVRRIMRGTYHTYMHDKGINVKQYWGVLNDDNPSPISPSRERGIHDIWNEISCPSSPGFIFHDSFGVEAGASDEWEVIQHFIKTRASSSSLEERLHAIWFCLPTDTDRPLLNVERNFFSVDTFGVPVIAVFTKVDAQHVKAYEGLRNQGITRKQAWMQARSVAYKFLHDYLEVEVMKLPHPPASCVCLENMHKPHAPCEDLIRHTANALTDDNMRKIFISTQKNNIKLCVEFAIHNNFHETLQRGRTVAQNLLALAAWFPLSSNREMFKSQEISLTDFTELASFVTRKYYDIKMSRRSSYMMAAKALIILENCSYRRGTLKENISAAIEAFKSSDVKSKLNKRIKADSKENRTDEELQKWLYGIICNNLMDHQNLVFSTIGSRAYEKPPNEYHGLGRVTASCLTRPQLQV